MATTTVATQQHAELSREDRTQLLLAQLMEGGREDDETCRDLDMVTALLNEDYELTKADKNVPSICNVIDADCLDTILGHMDLRQPEEVRAHATLTSAAYLKAAGEEGAKALSTFFFDRVRRGTYDDFIVAFCVASHMFPIAPELISELFLSPGFLPSLAPLMNRKWKSRKVETACLEMLNAACMHPQCREAVEKYCIDWLEEVVDQDPNEVTRALDSDTQISLEDGSVNVNRHSIKVQIMAGVVLAKIRTQLNNENERVQVASTTIEELAEKFIAFQLTKDDGHEDLKKAKHHSIEGLAYATLRSTVKERVAHNADLLKNLVKSLNEAPAKSPTTYGALSIFVNLTRYRPSLTEEEEKIRQLKAYANAAGKLSQSQDDSLDDNTHVSERCRLVFEAGITPVLVTHSKNGSTASLSLIVSIINSISFTSGLRGKLAQQGAVKLLLTAWANLQEGDPQARQMAAQALARILISINPALVFGGNRATPVTSAIRPLVSILAPDQSSDKRDLLPSFESLMALTNLASMDSAEVTKAAVELICNLVQDIEGMALYADGTPQAKQRVHILLALADSEDVEVLFKLCKEESDDLRHRAAFVLRNIVTAEGQVGELGRKQIADQGGVEVLTEAAKKTRRPEVLEVVLEVLKILVEGR
ncbi:unnamed protein product [Parascedosporium putredinis]|uniref:UNC-45/Cro1/She4 central domain-containing protein n=1 Tax=Parascedosporium putredinis TaxID=1442378 RepID=A0A9P1MDR8_9PEZI|nr:unnamed protein product [Parascedosporium putredinis]CAI8001133.1 unnamed protein product [Parascedosporium putredinis]